MGRGLAEPRSHLRCPRIPLDDVALIPRRVKVHRTGGVLEILGDPRSIEQIVFVAMYDRWHIQVTFPAVDDPEQTADAIGRCFDAAIEESVYRPRADMDELLEPWGPEAASIDSRLQLGTPLALLTEEMGTASLFGA